MMLKNFGAWKGGLLALAAGLCLGAAALPAAAQDKDPSMPVNLVIPFGPGAATDAVARIVGEGLSRQLGQPVIVINKPAGITG